MLSSVWGFVKFAHAFAWAFPSIQLYYTHSWGLRLHRHPLQALPPVLWHWFTCHRNRPVDVRKAVYFLKCPRLSVTCMAHPNTGFHVRGPGGALLALPPPQPKPPVPDPSQASVRGWGWVDDQSQHFWFILPPSTFNDCHSFPCSWTLCQWMKSLLWWLRALCNRRSCWRKPQTRARVHFRFVHL